MQARDERERFAEWKASLPKVNLGPLPELSDSKDCRRYFELQHKVLTYPGLIYQALTPAEREEYEILSGKLFDH